jgi:hypothetical protein
LLFDLARLLSFFPRTGDYAADGLCFECIDIGQILCNAGVSDGRRNMQMVTPVRTKRRSAGQYVAIGLPPQAVAPFLEQLEEEGACQVRIEQDDEGSSLVFFELAAWDSGDWLPALSRQFGCGVAPTGGGRVRSAR